MYEPGWRLKFGYERNGEVIEPDVCDWFILCQIAKDAETFQHFKELMEHVPQSMENINM